MAQGLFCTLLIGTIITTLGAQFGIGFLTKTVATVSDADGVNGNFFTADDLKRRLLEEQPRMSNTLFRKYIKKLVDGGIAKPTATEGRYILNPSFGLKGSISEDAYKRITKSFELGE